MSILNSMKYCTRLSVVGVVMVSMCLASIASAQASPSNYTTGTRYNENRQVVGVISPDPDGSGGLRYAAVRNTYNAQGLLSKVETGELRYWKSHTIAPKNWGSHFTNYISTVTTYTYDRWGRKLTERVYDNASAVYATKQYTYDSLGQLQCEAVRMNPIYMTSLPSSACSLGTKGDFGNDRITRYYYDGRGRVTSIYKAYGTSLQQRYVKYTYKGNSQLKTSVTDANGNYAKYGYDGFGRMTRWYFPSKTATGAHNDGDHEAYDYDENSNRDYFRKRDGQVISYEYDALNRVSKKDAPGIALDVAYSYDNRNLQTSATFTSNNRGVTNAYTGFGEIKHSETTMDGTPRRLSYTYDRNGNRERITHPDAAYFRYTYDGLNRTKTIHERLNTTLATGHYNRFGALERISRGSGSSTEFDFDKVMRLKNFKQNLSGSTYDTEYDFDFNPAGQIIKRGVGNDRYHYLGDNNIEGNYTVNGLNQYTQAGGKTATYNYQGSLKSYDGTNYGYDVENRLTSVSGRKNATLKYDPMGRLYEYTAGGTTRRFLYDGDRLVAEYDTAGRVKKRYVHGNGTDKPLVEYDGNKVNSEARRYLFTDYQGSVIATTNSSGTLLNVNSYDAFGIPDDGNVGRFGYTGQMYLKELGLYHYKARVYDPRMGRFLQTDPIGYEDQVNLYTYVGSDPVNMSDPTGLSSDDCNVTTRICTGGISASSGQGADSNSGDVHSRARTTLGDINPKSIAENKEYGSFEYRLSDGTEGVVTPFSGDREVQAGGAGKVGIGKHIVKFLNDNPGAKILSDIHTHGKKGNYRGFSTADAEGQKDWMEGKVGKMAAFSEYRGSYVATRTGDAYFLPAQSFVGKRVTKATVRRTQIHIGVVATEL